MRAWTPARPLRTTYSISSVSPASLRGFNKKKKKESFSSLWGFTVGHMNYEQYVSHSTLKNCFKDLCIIDPIHSGGDQPRQKWKLFESVEAWIYCWASGPNIICVFFTSHVLTLGRYVALTAEISHSKVLKCKTFPSLNLITYRGRRRNSHSRNKQIRSWEQGCSRGPSFLGKAFDFAAPLFRQLS